GHYGQRRASHLQRAGLLMSQRNHPGFLTFLRHRRGWVVAVTALAGLAGLASLSCVNPEVVKKTQGGLYPLAPGAQPFVLVTMIKDTTATIAAQLLVDEGRLQPTIYTFENFEPGVRTQGVLLPYPFLRAALGNLDNPFAPSISATLPD